jgi:hypothetical protein
MPETFYYLISMLLGISVFVVILRNLFKNVKGQSVLVTTTLCLIAFLLVSGPIWNSIAVKGPNWELKLVRESLIGQLESLLTMGESINKISGDQKVDKLQNQLQALRRSLEVLKAENSSQEERIKALVEANEAAKLISVETEYIVAGVEG